MREKEVKLLKVCMGADDRELARYAKTKLKDKGFLIEENVVSKGRRLSDHDLYELYHSNDPFLSMKSRELVVLYYKNYVYSLIDSYFHAYMMDYEEDLYQCGAVGLLKSLVHYDGTYTIMTYSRMYIIHEMTGYVYYLKNIPSTHYAKVRRLVVNAEEKLEKEGNIFVLRPEMKPVSRLEKDYDKLMAFYDHGYEMMKRELPRLEAYLEK